MSKKRSDEVRKFIGEALKTFRKDKGLSQEELAQRMGVNQSTIAKVEKGRWNFSIDLLADYALHLNCYIFLIEKDSKDPLAVEMRNRWMQSRTDN